MNIRMGNGVGFGPITEPLPYADFQKRVRRLPRTDLLRLCAATSAVMERVWPRKPPKVFPSVKPWSVAGVARTCLAAGTDDRSAVVTDDALARLCHSYIEIDNPAVRDDAGIERVMTPLAFEQFGSQYSKMENLARTPSLLLDHADGVSGAPTAQDWIDLLGVDLEQYMRVGFAAYVAVVQNGGSVSRDLLTAEHLAPIFAPLSAAEALAVLDQHFIAPLDELRDLTRRRQIPQREKWSWNPLTATPLVDVGGGDLVAPAAHFVIDKITPTGLYYTALDAWGERFTDALGTMFENYIGTHLAQLAPHAEIHPEIVYDTSEKKSCDYLLVFKDVVVLVETKTTRPTMLVRSGQDEGEAELIKRIGHARDQLNRTARLIRERHASFTHIPADRPMVGLIVTLEPYHLQQTGRAEQLFADNELPVSTACAHDVEGTVPQLVGADDTGVRLLDALGGDQPWQRQIRQAAAGLPDRRIPILDAAFRRWATWPRQAGQPFWDQASPGE